MNRFWLGLALFSGATTPIFAQVRAVADRQQWFLTSGESTYVVGVDERNTLESLYWGPALPADATLPKAQSRRERSSNDGPVNTTPLEYPAWGQGLQLEPALKVDSANGDRTLVLVYESAKVTGNQLEIVLKDTSQPIRVHLHYQCFTEGVLARWSTIENAGKQPVRIEQAASATWNLPAGRDYSLSWLTGMWSGEFQLHTAPLQPGGQVIESRRGSTGHQANPWFSIGREGQTTENAGPVWFGELGWSGSWRLNVERTALDLLRITGGYNPYDFGYQLAAGQSLDTPHFYAGYTAGGNGEASRILHRFQLAQILPLGPVPKPRPIIYNSWEATEFHVSEAGQIALAEKAASLGVERFVMDDGWFGKRKDDHAGLGDWYVDKDKFPNGLKPLIDRVHGLGMSFGLWVEPEMVNPDSDLYRKHPDWTMHFPDRQRTEGRNQLVLNLAKPEVKQYVFDFLDDLVSKNDIAFLKWDYNRNWSEPGWDEAPGSKGNPDAQKEIYVTYVQNLYDVMAKLRAKHPKLEIESCASGGGRTDLGILKYTDEVWPSDNTDALDRLSIQDGFTHAYTPQTMAAWVTDVPNQLDRRNVPLQFRFLVAMQGALGIGNDLNKFTPADMDLSKRMVDFYKTIRTTVQQGKLYRLQRPEGSEGAQVQYVSQDGTQAVVFTYLHSQQYGLQQPGIALQGLDPKAHYRVKALDEKKYLGEAVVSGAVLMGSGLPLRLAGDYDSTAVVLQRE
ncbi:MAG: alpha-galactosidase [Janthinobacterium lividum]